MVKDHLVLRNALNKRRPKFYKQSSHKKSRIEKKWRKARGSDSKVKIGWRNRQPMVKHGYRGPADVRGLSKDGFNIILVNNLNDLKNVNKTKDIVCIGRIGQRKKMDIIEDCIKNGLKIMNVKDPQGFLSESEIGLKQRKETKSKKEQEKVKKTETKKDKKDEGIEEKLSKQEEKKEKDKVLTKREL